MRRAQYIHGRPPDANERFRERRRRRLVQRRRRRLAAAVVLLGGIAGLALGATFISNGATPAATVAATPVRPAATQRALVPRAYPAEVHGVHVTMALAGLDGRIERYLGLKGYGLNTLQVDVKDENGTIGFVTPEVPQLARDVGAAQPYYDPAAIVARVHAAGMYLIGRVVVFEDPILAAARPGLALRTADGSLWRNSAGLAWVSPYSRTVWKYAVDISVAAAKQGFDEIQFDYVRFPSDGDLSAIVYPGARAEPKGETITAFVAYAAGRLHRLGVRVSADVFGLAASRDIGIGQVPRKLARHVDALYPMVYPSHFGPGELGVDDPNSTPGRIVARAMYDFRRQVKGTGVQLIPWLQDFSIGQPYGLIEVSDQIAGARRQHARGYLLWNPEGVYTREALGE